MASRSTAFSRTMAYFRTADMDEARAALNMATDILHSRIPTVTPPKQRRTRRAKVNSGAAAEQAHESLADA